MKNLFYIFDGMNIIGSVWFGNYYTFWNNHSINYHHYQIYLYARADMES